LSSSYSTFIAVSGGAEKEVVGSSAAVPVVLVPGACTENTAKNSKRWPPCPN
jgi:hypothetical protein